MKETGHGPVTAAAAFAALCLLATASPALRAADRVHVVVKGDTLWDISTSYLYDPFLWPQVWNVNRDIENPHLIYPGQEIAIPSQVVRRPSVQEQPRPVLPPPAPEPAVGAPAPEPRPEPPPPPVTEEARQRMIMLLSTYGFIVQDEEIGLGTLSSAEERRMLVRPGMKVYVTTKDEAALDLNGRYSIVRVLDKVTHPVSGEKIGYLAKVLGDLTVVDSRKGLATAIVGEVYKEVRMGDHVIEHIDYLTWLPESGPGQPLNLQGSILVNPEGKKLLGRGDVVFLDLGSNNGLATGDVLSLVQTKGAIGNVEPPQEVMGEVQIIVARPETSLARITQSHRDIALGTRAVTTLR